MYRSMKVGQALARVATRLQPLKTWPASQVPMFRKNTPVRSHPQARWNHGDGEGKGGGSGGSIRSAGGTFGKKQAADEEMYFREETANQISNLKKGMRETLSAKLLHHQKELDIHKECLKRHLDQMAKDGSTEQHQWHINHHEQSVKYEQAEVDKIKDMWKKLKLD